MTWSLSASGHTPAPPAGPGQESPGWEGVEQDLFDELHDVLSKPEYGCGTSSFGGNYAHGSPHLTSLTVPAERRHPATAQILRHFEYGHLPPHLQAVSARVKRVAVSMAHQLPDSPELTAGLRKLLEAKDCFVRAALEHTQAGADADGAEPAPG